jgi:hypothetical protein
VAEPRSLPELVAARASGGLKAETFAAGATFGALADPATTPADLRFLHDGEPWRWKAERGVAVLPPLTVLIAARAVARAAGFHEQDRVALAGEPSSPRLRVAGIAAALYAGSALVGLDEEPTVLVGDDAITIDGEARPLVGWPETCGVALLGGQPLDRMETATADDGELLVRGPLVMEGYEHDPKATWAAFRGGWFRTFHFPA